MHLPPNRWKAARAYLIGFGLYRRGGCARRKVGQWDRRLVFVKIAFHRAEANVPADHAPTPSHADPVPG